MLKDTLNKGISTPIAISIILILVVLVGGFTWWQYSEIRKEENELPEIEIPEKKECNKEKDCILRDVVVNEPCPPCDNSSPEYQCVSIEEAKRIYEEQKEKYGILPCSPCPPESIGGKRFKCICEENECLKVEDETADWETYRDERYRFEVNYPEKWNVFKSLTSIFSLVTAPASEIDSLEIFSVDEVESDFFSKKENVAIIYLYFIRSEDIEGEKEKQDTEDPLEAYRLSFEDNVEKFKRWKDAYIDETEIGGRDAIKTHFIEEEHLSEKEIKEKTYFIYYVLDKNSNGIFQIWGIFQGENQEQYISDFNQMLSTFRFLD